MQHCWMLHVASVGASCCKLLRVVWSCCAKFETGQTVEPTTPNISFVLWSPKRSATMLDPFAPLFQHSWDHARAQYTWPCTWSPMVSKVLWVVSFPRCTPEPNIVGSCCIRLHIAAKTSVCAHLKTKFERNVILWILSNMLKKLCKNSRLGWPQSSPWW